MGKPFIDRTNQIFDFWTVTGPHKPVPRSDGRGNRTLWFCTCQCGNTAWVDATNLRGGTSTNCGCQRETKSTKQQAARSASGKANTTHGMSQTRVYKIWRGMLERCNTPSVGYSYQFYGAKGIRVCERWKKFENFLTDMGEPPSDTHEIERKNHLGDYTPENCEWIPGKHQNRNTRRNIRTPKGEALSTFAERNKLTHQEYQALHYQFARKGLPFNKSLDLIKEKFHITRVLD